MKKICLVLFLIISFFFTSGFTNYDEVSGDDLITYIGSDTIVKDSSSILLIKDITQLVSKNFVVIENEYNVDSFSLVVFEDKYTGFGSTIGEHKITFKAMVNLYDSDNKLYVKSFTKDIKIQVVNGLGCNYIFEDYFYTYKNNIITEDNMTLILKFLKKIPDVDLFINYESDYFEEIEKEEIEYSNTEYLVNYSFVSSSGESGEGSINLKIIESNFQFNIDKITDNSLLKNLYFFIPIAILTLIAIKLYKNNKKTKNKKWRY